MKSYCYSRPSVASSTAATHARYDIENYSFLNVSPLSIDSIINYYSGSCYLLLLTIADSEWPPLKTFDQCDQVWSRTSPSVINNEARKFTCFSENATFPVFYALFEK